MSAEILTAILALIGIIASARLMTYRLQQLEKKVDKHNCLIERTFKIEERLAVHDERLSELFRMGDDLK